MNRQVNLYTESNPNPHSLKFVANFMLLAPGESHDFPDVESAHDAPLAKGLFEQFPSIKRVFYMSNFVTVTKDENVEWAEIQEGVKNYIKSFLEEGKDIIEHDEAHDEGHHHHHHHTDDIPEIDIKIRGILDEYIKPAVEMDGGAIEFKSFNDGVVTVQLQGACSGCPSSIITLKSGIENLLKTMVPEVVSVEAEEV